MEEDSSSFHDSSPRDSRDLHQIVPPRGRSGRQARLSLSNSVATFESGAGSDRTASSWTAVEAIESMLAITLLFTDFCYALQTAILFKIRRRAKIGRLPWASTASSGRFSSYSSLDNTLSSQVHCPPCSIVDTCPGLSPVITTSPIYVFDKSVYTSTLDEHTLVAMENAWSNVSSILMELSNPLEQHIIRAVSTFTQHSRHGQYPYTSYRDGALIIHKRLDEASFVIEHFIDRYRLYWPHVYEQNSKAAEARDAVKPNSLQISLIVAPGPLFTYLSAYLGFNYIKMYWDPYADAYERFEVTCLALATFKREMRKLESIAQGILDIKYYVAHMSVAALGRIDQNCDIDCVVKMRDEVIQSWRRLFAQGETSVSWAHKEK